MGEVRDTLMVCGTRFEVHDVDGVSVYVKREDECCIPPGPAFSKMRGLEAYIRSLSPDSHVGVHDAATHTRAGWGAAYLCHELGLPCYVFYPVHRARGTIENHTVQPCQVKARELGAKLMPIQTPAGPASAVWYIARNMLRDIANDKAVMLPLALKLRESVDATAIEAARYTPDELCGGTWIAAISSGTVASGVLKGMKKHQEGITFVMYMSHTKRDKRRQREYMVGMAGYDPYDMMLVDEGWQYSSAETRKCPFPASPHFEGKAWHWLVPRVHDLRQPIVFWNVGT